MPKKTVSQRVFVEALKSELAKLPADHVSRKWIDLFNSLDDTSFKDGTDVLEFDTDELSVHMKNVTDHPGFLAMDNFWFLQTIGLRNNIVSQFGAAAKDSVTESFGSMLFMAMGLLQEQTAEPRPQDPTHGSQPSEVRQPGAPVPPAGLVTGDTEEALFRTGFDPFDSCEFFSSEKADHMLSEEEMEELLSQGKVVYVNHPDRGMTCVARGEDGRTFAGFELDNVQPHEPENVPLPKVHGFLNNIARLFGIETKGTKPYFDAKRKRKEIERNNEELKNAKDHALDNKKVADAAALKRAIGMKFERAKDMPEGADYKEIEFFSGNEPESERISPIRAQELIKGGSQVYARIRQTGKAYRFRLNGEMLEGDFVSIEKSKKSEAPVQPEKVSEDPVQVVQPSEELENLSIGEEVAMAEKRADEATADFRSAIENLILKEGWDGGSEIRYYASGGARLGLLREKPEDQLTYDEKKELEKNSKDAEKQSRSLDMTRARSLAESGQVVYAIYKTGKTVAYMPFTVSKQDGSILTGSAATEAAARPAKTEYTRKEVLERIINESGTLSTIVNGVPPLNENDDKIRDLAKNRRQVTSDLTQSKRNWIERGYLYNATKPNNTLEALSKKNGPLSKGKLEEWIKVNRPSLIEKFQTEYQKQYNKKMPESLNDILTSFDAEDLYIAISENRSKIMHDGEKMLREDLQNAEKIVGQRMIGAYETIRDIRDDRSEKPYTPQEKAHALAEIYVCHNILDNRSAVVKKTSMEDFRKPTEQAEADGKSALKPDIREEVERALLYAKIGDGSWSFDDAVRETEALDGFDHYKKEYLADTNGTSYFAEVTERLKNAPVIDGAGFAGNKNSGAGSSYEIEEEMFNTITEKDREIFIDKAAKFNPSFKAL